MYPHAGDKIERYHRTSTGEINLVPCEISSERGQAIASLMACGHHRRYQEASGKVTPAGGYFGQEKQNPGPEMSCWEMFGRETLTILGAAEILIEQRRKEYNQVRSHSAGSYRQPAGN